MAQAAVSTIQGARGAAAAVTAAAVSGAVSLGQVVGQRS